MTMKRLYLLVVFIFLSVFQFQSFAQVSFGKAVKINDGWKFIEKDVKGASMTYADDAAWSDVELPHDWSVGHKPSDVYPSCMGYLPCGIGTYRKHLNIPDIADGRKFYIYFEGVYNRSSVWINGHHLGTRPNGYVSFMYDLTPYLNRDGDNVVTVRVDHSRGADSRWYTGSGIYRNVWLVESPEVHIAQWGVYAVPVCDGNGRWYLDVETEVENGSDEIADLTICNTLRSPSGKIVAKSKEKVLVDSKSAGKSVAKMPVARPELWDIDSPVLYTLETEILNGRQVLDRTTTKTGFRKFGFSPDEGFSLNGRNLKMKGVCLHHDAGVLGAAVPEVVWKERLLSLKDLGCNAIRTTHNPQSPALYDLCDELGFLVLNEAFDEWEFPKRKWIDGWNVGTPLYEGSYDFFEEWSEKDMADMVRRDRNHISVFAWSIGNEVDYPNDPYSHPVLDGDSEDGFSQPAFGGYKPDAPDAMRLGAIAKRLAGIVREYDQSRPVTAGLAGVAMSNETEYPAALDIAGYNYTESRYLQDHGKYPERVIYGSENRHDYNAWKAVAENRHIFGQFLWTGIDYLGESNPWPSRGLGTGLLDFASNAKPLGHFRKSLWTDEPYVHISSFADSGDPFWSSNDIWNFHSGDTVNVVCFTNAHNVSLLLNGSEIGEKKMRDENTGIIVWRIPYSDGDLTAEACDADGHCIARHTLYTTGAPAKLDMSVSGKDEKENIYILDIRVLDETGRQVNDAENIIGCHLEGPAAIIGIESGSNTDMSRTDCSSRSAFRGRLKVYVKCNGAGSVTVSCMSDGLQQSKIELK